MLTNEIREKLKSNWGEKADSLNCFAEVKLIDPLSSWACYLFAMSPDEERLLVLFYNKNFGIELGEMHTYELSLMHNREGEPPEIDDEYRRMRVTEIIRRNY